MSKRAKQWFGLGILLAAVLIAGGYMMMQSEGPHYDAVTLRGYVGGEKIGFLQSRETQDALRNRYRITLDYAKAGSLEMVEGSTQGRDFLWPSSQMALDIYKRRGGAVASDTLIFNSPIVFYTWDVVADALVARGMVENRNGIYYVSDQARLIGMVVKGSSWSEIGLDRLYGKMRIVSTDPVKSNSGNQFLGLMAHEINNRNVVNDESVDAVLPVLKKFFASQGFMSSSSGDLFSQFLKQGAGAFPIIAAYENQIVEFAMDYPDEVPNIKSRVRLLYPQPTVWSNHPLIALNDRSRRLADALLDPDLQKAAWSRHGFRTGLPGGTNDPSSLKIGGVASAIDMVVPMPKASVMEKMIAALEQ